MLTLRLANGHTPELGRPPEWDAAVEDGRIEASCVLGATIAAKVTPVKLMPGPNTSSRKPLEGTRGRTVPSRQHRGGWGFWSAEDGRFERWGDPAWSTLVPVGGDLLVCRYFEHRVQRLAWPGLEVRAEHAFPLPQCGIEELRLSPSGRLGIAYLNSGQGENGYELFDAATLRPVDGAPGFTLPVMMSPPAFTPDEQRIVAVFGASENDKYNRYWWLGLDPSEDPEEDATSPGGAFPFAVILVHDIATGLRTRHRVDVDLPAGWTTDLVDLAWCVPEIVALANEELVLGVPNGHRLRLALPLEAYTVVVGLG